MMSEEYYSVKSPPCSSLSALESKIRQHQSELNNLDEKISERMSSLNASLRRRNELRKQLAEIEADIDADRVGCRLLMQRRNSLRRDVERYEECKLDLLLDNEWRPNGENRENMNQAEITPAQGTYGSSQFESSSARSGEENSSQEQVLSLDEEQMRLKLLARMRKDLQKALSEEKDEEDRATPTGSVEEYCNQSTQTINSEDAEEAVVPLYR
ncbi:hypothetical protein OESDEN_23618 [Oesophagostomum dentatum]|uniref:Uncharacterized protein n=1 Tax=Oesophagostomum dentatum TaxID=61180 RepID=A0A0B1RZT5_OESDE|nr:hypothetical protein OESDEN_23618 [Oesophagostomum dentatum]